MFFVYDYHVFFLLQWFSYQLLCELLGIDFFEFCFFVWFCYCYVIILSVYSLEIKILNRETQDHLKNLKRFRFEELRVSTKNLCHCFLHVGKKTRLRIFKVNEAVSLLTVFDCIGEIWVDVNQLPLTKDRQPYTNDITLRSLLIHV